MLLQRSIVAEALLRSATELLEASDRLVSVVRRDGEVLGGLDRTVAAAQDHLAEAWVQLRAAHQALAAANREWQEAARRRR